MKTKRSSSIGNLVARQSYGCSFRLWNKLKPAMVRLKVCRHVAIPFLKKVLVGNTVSQSWRTFEHFHCRSPEYDDMRIQVWQNQLRQFHPFSHFLGTQKASPRYFTLFWAEGAIVNGKRTFINPVRDELFCRWSYPKLFLNLGKWLGHSAFFQQSISSSFHRDNLYQTSQRELGFYFYSGFCLRRSYCSATAPGYLASGR